MRILLDTHAIIWYREGNPRLSPMVSRMIADTANQAFVSIVSLWEMSIKRSRGKLMIALSPVEMLAVYERGGAELLPVSPEHVMAVETLPWHHRDPFDRMLVAQAKVENLTLITGDAALRRYDVPQIW